MSFFSKPLNLSEMQGAKSTLAKLLASENLNVRHSQGVKAATFNAKTRVLTLPIWKDMNDDVYDLLVGHEVGHALETPVDTKGDIAKLANTLGCPEKNIRSFVQVIEDARIEKHQKKRYPGLRKNFFNGYSDLLDRNFFGTKGTDLNDLRFIDRLNLHEKVGSLQNIQFNNKEEESIVQEVESVESWKDVLEAAKRAYEYARDIEMNTESDTSDDEEEEEEDKKKKKQGGKGGKPDNSSPENAGKLDQNGDPIDGGDEDDGEGGEGEGEDGEGDGEGEGDQGKDGKDGQGQGQGQGNQGQGNQGQGQGQGQGNQGKQGNGKSNGGKNGKNQNDGRGGQPSGGAGGHEAPISKTNENWERSIELLADTKADQPFYVFPPTFEDRDLKLVVTDYKEVLRQKNATSRLNDSSMKAVVDFKQSERETISFMLKEFNMRKAADNYARTNIAKSGILDTNRLHKYKYSEDVFKKFAVVKDGKNHGFVIFVDWSSSMSGRIDATVEQLVSITMFCKSIQVPFEVYSFKTDGRNYRLKPKREGDLMYNNTGFELRNLLSSRMNIHEYNEAIQHLFLQTKEGRNYSYDGMGGTPLDSTIVVAESLVQKFRKETHVQVTNVVFLTDGESNGFGGVYGNGGNSASRSTYYIVQDEKTKNEHTVKNGNFTATLLKILKDRTGVNLIGFYMYDSSPQYIANLMRNHTVNTGEEVKQKDIDIAIKDYTNKGYCGIKTAGYDEYYIIDSNKMGLGHGKTFMSKAQSVENLTENYIKFSKNKTYKRQMLRTFIEKICADSA